jgi:hypothetical protein
VTALRASRRRRTLGAFAAGMLSLAAVPLLGLVAVDALRNSKEGRNAIESTVPLVAVPATPGVLFATVDDTDAVTSLAVMALAPAVGEAPARGGTVINVPVTAEAILSTGETVNIADAYAAGGADELQAVAEGLLGVTLSGTIVADETMTTELLARAAPVPVELAAEVRDTTPDGDELALFPAGPAELGANDVAALLVARAPDDQAADLYARNAMVWEAMAARVGDGLAADGTPVPPTTASPTTASPASVSPASGSTTAGGSPGGTEPAEPASTSTSTTLEPSEDPAGFMDAFLSGPIGSYQLSAEPVSGVTTGAERTRVNLAEVNLVMATVLPGAISPSFASITFFVRSPLGDPELTLEAVAMLLFAGANVVLVKEDPTIPVPAQSTLEVVDESDLVDARRFVTPFGSYEEVPPEVRIEGVDAILTLGESYRALLQGDAPTPTTIASETTVSGSEG